MGSKEKLNLMVSERSLSRKKVNQLRRDGIIPGVVHGKDFESTPVQVDSKSFEKVYKKSHGTSIVTLKIDGKTVPVLVHSIQRNKLNKDILHIEFLKIDLARDVTVEVPIIFEGTCPAEKEGKGRVSHEEMSIHLKCTPAHIPSEIVVDVSVLKEKHDSIHASDLKLPEGVSLAHGVSENKVIATVVPSRYIEMEAPEAEEVEGEAAPEVQEAQPKEE
ncbi:MAG: 50S ribosomal protein L25 [Desulfomonilia bacterium]